VHLVATVPLAGRAVADEVVVRRGDTLWDIAARHLGPGASAAEVAAEWPRWHRVNGEVIGPRPDHILPGQRLRPPAVASHPDPRSPR
jgi:nucleoid-associated protein YgaU